jgi:hypothetical protein
MNSSIAASTIAARRSAARVARFEAGACSPASGAFFARAPDGVTALVGFFVMFYL